MASDATADGLFGERVAAGYDERCGEMNDEAVLGPTIDFLSSLAGAGRALEFAIGTGRVALPLSARGIEVHGIEMSRAMIAQMMTKPGADKIDVTVGDMATTRVDGKFQLVYLVYNTITNLLSQDQQVECFRNAAAHLRVGGHFVIEVVVPSLQRLQPGESLIPFEVSAEHVLFDEYDIVDQMLTSHHYWITDGQVEIFDSQHRYAWPAEYDLMARIAGLSPDGRWSNWQRDPFTADSPSHISVWTKT